MIATRGRPAGEGTSFSHRQGKKHFLFRNCVNFKRKATETSNKHSLGSGRRRLCASTAGQEWTAGHYVTQWSMLLLLRRLLKTPRTTRLRGLSLNRLVKSAEDTETQTKGLPLPIRSRINSRCLALHFKHLHASAPPPAADFLSPLCVCGWAAPLDPPPL